MAEREAFIIPLRKWTSGWPSRRGGRDGNVASPEMSWGLVLEDCSGGEGEITTSTNFLVPHGELLSCDRKYFSEERDLMSIVVGANSISKFSE